MPVTFEIISIPLGSQFIERIDTDDPEDLNDFSVLIVASDNTTGLTESDITVSAVDSANRTVSITLLSFEGENSVWLLSVRPPDRFAYLHSNFGGTPKTGLLTVRIAANAVDQGNAETSKDIRMSTAFPDTNAETPTVLISGGNFKGVTVTPTRILVAHHWEGLRFYTHSGTQLASERISTDIFRTSPYNRYSKLDAMNGRLCTLIGSSFRIYNYTDGVLQWEYGNSGSYLQGVAHTRLGMLFSCGSGGNVPFKVLPFPLKTGAEAEDLTSDASVYLYSIAHQNDLVYGIDNNRFHCFEIQKDADEIHYIKRLNFRRNGSGYIRDLSLYGDTLYILTETHTIGTLDIRKYRPMAKNTKTTIYPVILPYTPNTQSHMLDLTVFSPDAERIVFDVGFDRPNWLSIDAQNRLIITQGAMTAGEVRTCYVKCRAINRINSEPFAFYLVIEDQSPRWKSLTSLTMKAGSSYDLFQIVKNATRIELHPDHTLPAGASLANGIYTTGTTGGQIGFRAFNDRTRQYADMDNVIGTF